MSADINRMKHIKLLLVDDNAADVFLTREMLAESNEAIYEVHVVRDGPKALEYLRSGSAGRPDIVLLDWNLPQMDGFEVLREIKADPRLKSIPVYLLWSPLFETDADKARESGAESYLVKPFDLATFESLPFVKKPARS